ncbi:hypothetical protein ABT392_07860 [Paucibacter sp. JuS9]|uniref:hypothetical protein n=1 Tax=Paucibacter sp. JuS9 TaxID=3228748 RepID=UPI003756F695
MSAIDRIVEILCSGDLTSLESAWRELPDLQALAVSMGTSSKLSSHALDEFAQRFRGTREYVAYMLHALGGIDARSNGPSRSIPETFENLEPLLRKSPVDRMRWIERARSVSEAVRELLWLLLIELKNAGQPRWIVDETWTGGTAGDALRVNFLAFSVRGANYRLTTDGGASEDGAHDTEPQVQFGWTDEDSSKVDWRETLDPLAVAPASGPTPLKSFASIEEFYTLSMLEPVVALRQDADAWRLASVNGLTPQLWQKRLHGLGVAQSTIDSVQQYYEFLTDRMLPNYPAQLAGDVLLALAFSVVPRELTGDHARRAATVFVKVAVHGLRGSRELSESKLHDVVREMWSRAGQLKVPLLKRIAADVIETTHEKSERLAMQAGLFEDMRQRMSEITRAAVQLEQKARLLNRQLATSAEDMELAYQRVAQLFDDSEAIRSPYYGVIAIQHSGGYRKIEHARWVLCAALSDLLVEPREIDASTLGAGPGTAAWSFLSDARQQLGLRIDTLVNNMRGPRPLWSADHIAALLMPVPNTQHVPLLPANDDQYAKFRETLLDEPAKALDLLKQRFFDLGRLGDGRRLELHVLLSQFPVYKAKDLSWDKLLCNTGAFVKPSALPSFLRAFYEKSMQRRIADGHPMREERDKRVLAKCVDGLWEFVYPAEANSAYLDPLKFVTLLEVVKKQDRAVAVNEQESGDQLRPFADLVHALDRRYRNELQLGVEDNKLKMQVTHGDSANRKKLTLWIGSRLVQLRQEDVR